MIKRLVKTFDEENNLINVLVPLTIDVEEVYFVYHHDVDTSLMKSCTSVINKYKKINIYYKKIKKYEIDKLLNENTILDVSAPKYLSIALYENALKNNLPVIYYDDEERCVKRYNDHSIINKDIFKLSIDDIIKLGGGKIESNLHKPVKNRNTINKIYEAVDYASNKYTIFTSFVSRINAYINDYQSENNTFHLNERTIKKILSDEQYHQYKDLNLFTIEGNDLTFFNDDIKKIFTVSGTFLENYIYHKLIDSNLFDEVSMSNTIEFSRAQWHYPVTCEIDCLVLKNNELLFISIKSNKVDKDALNEIKVHNVMFGNSQSKAVICSNNDLSQEKPSVYAKAEELKVYVIDNTSFKKDRLAQDILSIINQSYQYERI